MEDPNALTDPPVWCHWRTYVAMHPGYIPPLGFPDVHVSNYEALRMDLDLALAQVQQAAAVEKEVRKLLKRHKRQGDPRHGHRVPGCWDGDAKHPPGSACKACRNWDKLRELLEQE